VRVRSPVIVCFAGDVWDGNPHSRHHLMRLFAAGGWEVLFVEGVPMRSVRAGDWHELRRITAKLRTRGGLRTVAARLHVLRPLPIPPAGRLGRRAQLSTLRAQIAAARRRLHLDGPAVTWFSLPVAAPLLGRLGEQGSVLYYQDRYHEFSHVNAPYLRRCLQTLATHCDVSVATATALADDLRALGADPVLVHHGVDVTHFATERSVPADLANLERPLIGCVGLVDDHLDFGALQAVAAGLERGTVVLVGGVNTPTDRLAHRRIVLLGRRPYAEMPGYLHAFDACLVPFARNELTTAVNPIKLREYLAAGRPTVATDLPELRAYGDVVELVDDAWVPSIERALRNDSHVARARRRARVEQETWDAAAKQIEALMQPLVDGARTRR
jgi:glycosyltransferase involved in cell wall biosynthesis